jgi:hypothetical protein
MAIRNQFTLPFYVIICAVYYVAATTVEHQLCNLGTSYECACGHHAAVSTSTNDLNTNDKLDLCSYLIRPGVHVPAVQVTFDRFCDLYILKKL